MRINGAVGGGLLFHSLVGLGAASFWLLCCRQEGMMTIDILIWIGLAMIVGASIFFFGFSFGILFCCRREGESKRSKDKEEVTKQDKTTLSDLRL